MVTGAKDQSIRIFDFKRRELLHTFKTGLMRIKLLLILSSNLSCIELRNVAISPDNQYVVGFSENNSPKVFDLQLKKEIHEQKNIRSGIGIHFSDCLLRWKRANPARWTSYSNYESTVNHTYYTAAPKILYQRRYFSKLTI